VLYRGDLKRFKGQVQSHRASSARHAGKRGGIGLYRCCPGQKRCAAIASAGLVIVMRARLEEALDLGEGARDPFLKYFS